MVYGRNNKSFVLPVTILMQPSFFFTCLCNAVSICSLLWGSPVCAHWHWSQVLAFLLLLFSFIVFHITHSLYSSKPLSLVLTYSHYQHYQLSFACSLTVISAYWPTQHIRESKSFNQQQKIQTIKKWLLLCVCLRARVRERERERETNFQIS